MQDPAIKPARDVVVDSKCDCCGHHEGGIQTADGEYFPLNPNRHKMILLFQMIGNPAVSG